MAGPKAPIWYLKAGTMLVGWFSAHSRGSCHLRLQCPPILPASGARSPPGALANRQVPAPKVPWPHSGTCRAPWVQALSSVVPTIQCFLDCRHFHAAFTSRVFCYYHFSLNSFAFLLITSITEETLDHYDFQQFLSNQRLRPSKDWMCDLLSLLQRDLSKRCFSTRQTLSSLDNNQEEWREQG